MLMMQRARARVYEEKVKTHVRLETGKGTLDSCTTSAHVRIRLRLCVSTERRLAEN